MSEKSGSMVDRRLKGLTAFSERILSLRNERGLSQQDVADYCGASKTLIRFLERERNRPNWMMIRRLADLYDIDADELAALAGVVPDDVRRLMCERPELAKLVRSVAAEQDREDAK
jgi:transcriptional regulator with XRE-family HTH domain